MTSYVMYLVLPSCVYVYYITDGTNHYIAVPFKHKRKKNIYL